MFLSRGKGTLMYDIYISFKYFLRLNEFEYQL